MHTHTTTGTPQPPLPLYCIPIYKPYPSLCKINNFLRKRKEILTTHTHTQIHAYSSTVICFVLAYLQRTLLQWKYQQLQQYFHTNTSTLKHMKY